MTASKRQAVALMAAPTGIQPGGYVPVAYADRTTSLTGAAEVSVDAAGKGWSIALAWDCPRAVREATGETDRFVDACAIFAPEVSEAPWVTMGAARMAVNGWLWRPDKPGLLQVRAEGLGTMERSSAPAGAVATADWNGGQWRVAFAIPEWPAFATHRRLALAIWRGADQERAGLKSVSPGWVEVA